MVNKHELILGLLEEKLKETKVGLLVKGFSDINVDTISSYLSEKKSTHIYLSADGYSEIKKIEAEQYTISNSVEDAVKWRSIPECAGNIIAFVRNDTDKLHSLAEFEVVSIRDLTKHLIGLQIQNESNTPTLNFWKALYATSDYYPFDVVYDFVKSVTESESVSDAIPQNMWRLNLLRDDDILGTKNKPEDRLAQNRQFIFDIGQLSENSRKTLIRTLAKTQKEDKERLQTAYDALENYYKYPQKDKLKALDYDTVRELFSASKNMEGKKKKPTEKPSKDEEDIEDFTPVTPIRNKELGEIISDAIVTGNDDDMENVKELLSELRKHFDTENAENKDSIPTLGGIFEDRAIIIDNHQTDLRKLIGKVCNSASWGGLIETEESVLKDVIAADIVSFQTFSPTEKDSMISFAGGVDGNIPLFDFIIQFDEQFQAKGLHNTEAFTPIIVSLKELREKLIKDLDLIMYYPVLDFGADENARKDMIAYVDAWAKLYHAYSVNEPAMRELSIGGTSYIARALLLLDVLYIKTPKEWKGILLPLHPLYLWRYYEIFKTLPSYKAKLDDDDAAALTEVLNKLPQIMSFLVANSIVTGSTEDKVLPCSGNIEMLPTFENKTNRYLGDDGTESIGEILSRWVGFAPYTKNEVRLCSIDAPDLLKNIRTIKDFMDKNEVKRVVYDVYLTRKQNGNTELSKLDYSGRDYEIGEYIRQNKIVVSIKNVDSAMDIQNELSKKPVHVAFYFDQSSYAIDYGPNSRNLYVNPLVITYDYDFDEIQHKGSIYPSSEMDSGLIGDYHKLMRSADVIKNNKNPRTTYNGNADMTAVVSTIGKNMTQWLVVADRDTNNYDPENAIPIGEMQYDKRKVNVWTSSDSRIITQYMNMLRTYNLFPKKETLVELLKEFGHIASNGWISIPKFGADSQAIDNKKKGLLGTLFAASWYTKKYQNALVASLDDDKARLWLHDSRYGNERADLIGLRYEEVTNTLVIQPIEVKTRDDSPDAKIEKDETTGIYNITEHAANQIAAVVGMLKDIFASDNSVTDMFISARREVLKYQIVSECFRSVHNSAWQKQWYDILKRAFGSGQPENINIQVSGLLMYLKLSDATGGKVIVGVNPEFDDCPIEFRQLTAKEIQKEILGEETEIKEMWEPEFEVSEEISTETPDDNFEIDEEKTCEKVNSDTMTEVKPLLVAEKPERYSASVEKKDTDVPKEEIEQLVRDFKRSCGDYRISLGECNPEDAVVGPSVIRLKFKLKRGQALQGLATHLEDIGREMKRSGVIIQPVLNSDELLLDIPRLQRDKVLFADVLKDMPKVTSPEQLYFPLGRTPNGQDLIEDLSQMPHMLVGGSTGSGKSVFLFTMLASFLMTHPRKEDMQLILSSSKFEDFIHFEGLPHLYSGHIISDAEEATNVIKEVVFEESERRGRLLAEARVANIIEYNKIAEEKLAPIVVVIDEFADLADQLESKKEQNAFYKPVQRIAQAGRSRGIHLVICTQRPEAKLVPSTTKAQLNGRVALRVNDGISSRMIIEVPDAQYLQKHGDMIYRNGDVIERAQGYLITIPELDEIVEKIINM